MAVITPETARIFAQKAHEARRAAKRAAEEAAIPEDYTEARLARVRAQLDLVDEQIEAAANGKDAKRLKDLCDAQARLAEQERVLAGRPLPGSHRPSAPPRKRPAPGSFGPVD